MIGTTVPSVLTRDEAESLVLLVGVLSAALYPELQHERIEDVEMIPIFELWTLGAPGRAERWGIMLSHTETGTDTMTELSFTNPLDLAL